MSDTPHLTERQRAILRLVATGYLDKQIADLLGLSVCTVRTHLRRMSKRLGAKGRLHLALIGSMIESGEVCRYK